MNNHPVCCFTFSTVACMVFSFSSHGQIQGDTLTAALQHDSIPVQLYSFIPKLLEFDYGVYATDKRTYKRSNGNSYVYIMGPEQLFSVKAAVPIVKIKKKTSITLGLQYNYYDQPGSLEDSKTTVQSTFQYASFSRISTTISHKLSIQNKSVFLTGSFSFTGEEFWQLNQFNSVLSVSYPLRNTRTTSLMIGINYIYAKYATFPVIPSIIYITKLNTRLHFDAILPSHIKLRYLCSDKLYSSAGVKLGSDRPQYHSKNAIAISEQMELRNATFTFFLQTEYHLGGLFWMSAEIGYRYLTTSRLSDPNRAANDYYIQAKNEGSAYGNVGLFLRPPLKMVLSKLKQSKERSTK